MSHYLDLYNYRTRVSTLYHNRDQSFLANTDPSLILQHFRAQRDQLFANHPQSALDEEQRKLFRGLSYFPYNPTLHLLADIEPVPSQRQTVVMSAEETMTMITIARLRFTLEGHSVALSLYWLEIYGGGLFLPFHDTTSPAESYGGGRYLFDTIKSSGPLPSPGNSDRQILLDFNYAYNPSCAYNSRWVCPLAPHENRLPLPIRAGEKNFSLAL
jgi:uncharacterized protein (DUF1684 family)